MEEVQIEEVVYVMMIYVIHDVLLLYDVRFYMRPKERTNKRLRFIREEPVLASILAKRQSTVIPKPFYDWAVQWIADVGRLMRSRGMMASFVASASYYAILIKLFDTLQRAGLLTKGSILEKLKLATVGRRV